MRGVITRVKGRCGLIVWGVLWVFFDEVVYCWEFVFCIMLCFSNAVLSRVCIGLGNVVMRENVVNNGDAMWSSGHRYIDFWMDFFIEKMGTRRRRPHKKYTPKNNHQINSKLQPVCWKIITSHPINFQPFLAFFFNHFLSMNDKINKNSLKCIPPHKCSPYIHNPNTTIKKHLQWSLTSSKLTQNWQKTPTDKKRIDKKTLSALSNDHISNSSPHQHKDNH